MGKNRLQINFLGGSQKKNHHYEELDSGDNIKMELRQI
jgi:hypothetical protein